MIKAEWTNADALNLQPTCNQLATDSISRQAAIDALKAHEDYKGYLHGDFEEILEALPSAQPEIVRCKDCVHKWVAGENVRFNVCELNHNKVQGDDWFCADAERRTDEQTD